MYLQSTTLQLWIHKDDQLRLMLHYQRKPHSPGFPIKIPFVCLFSLAFGVFKWVFIRIWSWMITPNAEANVSKTLFNTYCREEGTVACCFWCTPLFVVCPSHMGWVSGLWAAIDTVLGRNYDPFFWSDLPYNPHTKNFKYSIKPDFSFVTHYVVEKKKPWLMVNFVHSEDMGNAFSFRLVIEKYFGSCFVQRKY